MKKDISDIEGTVGKVFGKYARDLQKIATKKDIDTFLDKITPELSEQAKNYVNDNVRSRLSTCSFTDAQRHMYNIYLAGFSDCKIS